MVNYWILVGNKENWKIAIDNSLWGIKKDFKNRWDNVKKEDILFFYAITPIKGIIGFAEVTGKSIGKESLWKDELECKKIIYPYRIEFKIKNKIDNEFENKVEVSNSEISLMAGINQIRNEGPIKRILLKFKSPH